MLLELEDVVVHYGKIQALRGVTLHVASGEVVTLIGGNGAGKTTTLRTISGLRPLTSGAIRFEGEDVSGVPPHRRVEMGICQSPEGRRIFPGMSVRENLEMGAYTRRGEKKRATREDFERVYELFPRLAERLSQPGGTLSGGEQQMLAIGRALMARPKLLLLDEPSMGLAPKLVEQIYAIITEIHDQGITILLVEQNATMALRHAQRAYVLETGTIMKTDNASELLADESIKAAYLGTGAGGS
jgi:branched-chain amino acid transport system ATP-binding protein